MVCSKNARRHFEVKMPKAPHVRTTFGNWGVQKVHAVVARNTLACHRRGGLRTLPKVSETCGFRGSCKTDGTHRTIKEDLQSCMSGGRRITKDASIRDIRRSGRWFPERGCTLEHHDRRSTSYDLASVFCGRRNTLHRWGGKITKRIGTRPSALHSTFHFWRSLAECLVFSISKFKIEEVSRNCFVLDLRTSMFWGSLTELRRFGHVNSHFGRKPCIIPSFQIER